MTLPLKNVFADTTILSEKEASMRFYTRQHRYYCGVDLHARSMYVCVLDADGDVLVSKNIASAPGPFLELIAPYREDLAVAAECMFTWYWLADLCARERDRVCARACALHARDPRWQGEERADRCAQDRRATARRDAAPSLCVSPGDALDT